jgi:putative toxin-antitoxin system antitoxin component (TIGR02293 family)
MCSLKEIWHIKMTLNKKPLEVYPTHESEYEMGFQEAPALFRGYEVTDLEQVWNRAQTQVAIGHIVKLNIVDLAIWNTRFSADEMDELVIPKRTLVRRRANHEALSPEETDKALRLARISTETDRVFGNPKTASRWLRKPLASYAGQTPLDLLKSETGALAVDEVLGQIDHGIFA